MRSFFMGATIFGMHYIDMAGATVNDAETKLPGIHISNEILAVIITVAIILLAGTVQIASIVHRKLLKNQESLEQLNKELSQSNHQLQDVLDNLDIAIWSYDETLRKLPYTSPGIEKITGYPFERFIDRNAWKNIIYPDDVLIFEKLSVKLRQGIPDTSEYRIIHASGEIRWIQNRIIPTMDRSRNMTRLDGVIIDITSQKMMERVLAESEAKYRLIAENMTDLLGVLDINGTIRYASPSYKKVVGIDDECMVGTSLFDYMPPEDFDYARKEFLEMVKTKTNKLARCRFIHADEYPVYVDCIGTPVLGDDGKVESIIVVSRDITEKVRIENELKDSEERYRRLVELSPVAIAVYKDDKFIYANPTGMKVVGAKSPEDIIGTVLLDWVHPDDKDLARELMESTMHNGYSSLVEYKIFRLDGNVVDISVTSIYDSKSSSIELVFEDITARKQAERALLESEELNRRLVELSPEAVVLHSDYKFNYVNPAGITLFGASSLSDMVGQSIWDRVHPDFKEQTALRLAGVYEQQSTSPFIEQKNVRFDGLIIDVEVIATSIPYKGKNAGLTLIRDITERKKAENDRKCAEQIIRESEERYFRLQTSLDRFSHDIFGLMKVSEMERRLVKEVQDVIRVTNISLLEVDRNNDVVLKSGTHDIPKNALEDIAILDLRHLPVCEIIDTPHGHFLKISEMNGKSHVLFIGEKTSSLNVTSKRVWLKTITRYVSVLYDSFRLIEDLTKELEQIASQQVAPSWLLRLLFNLSENERKHLSQDLHDAALQEQIIWYRKLDQLATDRSLPEDLREQLYHITQGLLDVIYQIRITCTELRPPMLKEEGLVSSLEALFESTQMSTDYSIQFDAADFHHPLHDDQLIGLYRIVQELLANAAKHSNATRVHITLSSHPDQVQLIYKDNGIGMDVSKVEDSFKSMGIYGMKERVRSMDGRIEFRSSPNKGLAIFISIPALFNSTK